MIKKAIKCVKCDSENIVKNGKSSNGKQKYKCLDCKAYRTLNSTRKTESEQDKILEAYRERSSLRGIYRVYKVTPDTILRWLKKKPLK